MKILEVKEESAHILVAFEVDPEMLRSEYTKHFESISKYVTVTGFRKGQAPIHMVVQHLKNRGKWALELEVIMSRIIEKEVLTLAQTDPELDKKIFGAPIESRIRDDMDLDKWFMQLEIKFEKFPEVSLSDYSVIPTLIEYKEPDLQLCPVSEDKGIESDDVVAFAMMGKTKKTNDDGKEEETVEMKYTYDMLEVDLSQTKIPREIVDALIGLKAKDKKELVLQDSSLGQVSLEIWVIDVRKKTAVDEKLVERLQIPGIYTVEQLQDAIKKQHMIHNSYVRYTDIMKWLSSRNNTVKPFPVENVRREATRLHSIASKKGSRETLESFMYTRTISLKQTIVLNAIAKQEKFEATDEDRAAFAKDIDSNPWLYGNKKSEEVFNCDPAVLNEYVLQFKTVQFLMERWKFSA